MSNKIFDVALHFLFNDLMEFLFLFWNYVKPVSMLLDTGDMLTLNEH